MDDSELSQRLTQIATRWSLLFEAHQRSTTVRDAARQQLLQRYGGAVFRYLLGAVGDADVAEELSQEFALRFLRGDFQQSDPERGRFRNYLKTSLVNLLNDYYRWRRDWPAGLEGYAPQPAEPTEEESDRALAACWRQQLLDRAWNALRDWRPLYAAVLRMRVESPEMTAREISERLNGEQAEGDALAPDAVRKTLQRARLKFSDLLVDEVAASLESDAPEPLRAELQELDLLRYCRAALQRRGERGA